MRHGVWQRGEVGALGCCTGVGAYRAEGVHCKRDERPHDFVLWVWRCVVRVPVCVRHLDSLTAVGSSCRREGPPRSNPLPFPYLVADVTVLLILRNDTRVALPVEVRILRALDVRLRGMGEAQGSTCQANASSCQLVTTALAGTWQLAIHTIWCGHMADHNITWIAALK